MTTESVANVAQLRAQLSTIDSHAERAFERAFDLQQAGAPAARVEAALAEVNRLQASARRLREQLGQQPVLH